SPASRASRESSTAPGPLFNGCSTAPPRCSRTVSAGRPAVAGSGHAPRRPSRAPGHDPIRCRARVGGVQAGAGGCRARVEAGPACSASLPLFSRERSEDPLMHAPPTDRRPDRPAAGPFEINAGDRATWNPRRHVLALVHHATAGSRLDDVLPLVEEDPRIQVLYTCPPGSVFADTGAEYVRRLGARTVPWSEVPKHRFDLAVAASLGMLASVAAPILEVGHGTGPGKLLPRIGGHGAPLRRPAAGAAPGGLTAYGRLLPTVIGVPHERHRALLSASVPEAAEAVRVVGDPCHDRLLAGLAARDRYRRALGAGPGDLLVLLTSTGGRHSLLGRRPDLPALVAAEARAAGGPVQVRTAAVTHPGV